jgi:DNA-binding protein YbaB
LSELAAITGTGEAAEGQVYVRVDGTGDIVDLVIEPTAISLGAAELAAAVLHAFRSARESVAETLRTLPARSGSLPGELQALLDLGSDAQRRLTELTSIADELSGRLRRGG